MRTSLLAALIVGVGCATARSPQPPTSGAEPANASASEPLPFIHDDYPRALALAKRRGVPLFVDVWAPW